jgi:hypothetical protein
MSVGDRRRNDLSITTTSSSSPLRPVEINYNIVVFVGVKAIKNKSVIVILL